MLSACSGVFCLVLPSLPLTHGECKDPATVLSVVKLLEKVFVYVQESQLFLQA